jgi:hypothetical protein
MEGIYIIVQSETIPSVPMDFSLKLTAWIGHQQRKLAPHETWPFASSASRGRSWRILAFSFPSPCPLPPPPAAAGGSRRAKPGRCWRRRFFLFLTPLVTRTGWCDWGCAPWKLDNDRCRLAGNMQRVMPPRLEMVWRSGADTVFVRAEGWRLGHSSGEI